MLNGPILDLLGRREPSPCGYETLENIEAPFRRRGEHFGLTVDFRRCIQAEEPVGRIQETRAGADGIVIDAAAPTHTSFAILDSLQAALSAICGLGALGCAPALEAQLPRLAPVKGGT